MKTIYSVSDLISLIESLKQEGKKIGFVPTMGALHQGHLSLLKEGKKHGLDVMIASIFVNPKQFNHAEDLEKYPRNLSHDQELLTSVSCDFLFAPDAAEMYPENHQDPHFSFGYLEEILEGAFRPGHFRGVGIIVSKLLTLVQPDRLFMGEKDLQQCRVISSLISQMELPQEMLITMPTIREESGLAMSSRNMRLTENGKKIATEIYQTMIWVKENFLELDWETLMNTGKERLEKAGFEVEYFEIRHKNSLLQLQNKSQPGVVLVAATIEGVRLIDNLFITD